LSPCAAPEAARCARYYVEEWVKEYENVKEMRRKAGKRTLLKTPPVLLLVKFITPNGERRGNTAAPAVIDLRKGELRTPSYGVVRARVR
jgi:hypothetical protein